jgi:hypothetical protein
LAVAVLAMVATAAVLAVVPCRVAWRSTCFTCAWHKWPVAVPYQYWCALLRLCNYGANLRYDSMLL